MQHAIEATTPSLRGLQLAALIALTAGATGCTAITDRMAARLSNQAFSKIEHEMPVFDGDVALFRQCLESRGGTCQGNASTPLPQTLAHTSQVAPLHAGLSAPVAAAVAALEPGHPARTGSSVLSHPFLQKITAVHNQLRGLPSANPVSAPTGLVAVPEATVTLSTSLGEVSDFVDQVNQATASGAWRVLSEQAAKQAVMGPSASPAYAAAQQDARTTAFIHRYMEAYFENGKFVKVQLDTRDLNAKVESYLSRNASLFCGDPAKGCDPLVTSLQNEVLKGVAKDPADQDYVLLALGTSGYVSRLGDHSFAFPGMQVTLDPAGARPASMAKIDLTQVGTDLVWVFFQALYDSHEGLPAVSQATGIDLGTNDKSFNLPVFNPDVGNVNEQDLQKIITFSNRASGVAGATFDKAIRGLGPFSLNNEVLEDLLTAIVTVTVDDVAQKAAWCWFSCNLDQQIEKAADNEREKVRSDLSKYAKRIKLRLRLL